MADTSDTWAAARTAYEAGEGLRAIARRLGLLPGTISKRAAKERWAKPVTDKPAAAQGAVETVTAETETPPPPETPVAETRPPVPETIPRDDAPAPAAAPASAENRPAASRWPKGVSGNPAGRAPGTRNRATVAAAALLDGEAEALSRKAVELALKGDARALRMCLERIVPPRRDRPVAFKLPPLTSADDAAKAAAALLDAVASGELTPSEAAELGRLLDSFVRALEATEFERRLAALEEERGRP